MELRCVRMGLGGENMELEFGKMRLEFWSLGLKGVGLEIGIKGMVMGRLFTGMDTGKIRYGGVRMVISEYVLINNAPTH